MYFWDFQSASFFIVAYVFNIYVYMCSDRPILIFFITDTDHLYVYVPNNRYAEPIFIYCYKVNK